MLFVVSIEDPENLKYQTFLLFALSVKMKMKKIFKAEKSIEILKSSWLN